MKLPEMVYKPRVTVTRASHVVIGIRDLQTRILMRISEAGFQSPTNALLTPLRCCVLSLGGQL